MKNNLTHFDDSGRVQMVDVSDKPVSQRHAVAKGRVRFSPAAFALLQKNGSKKGDIASVAELAGIMGAKKTSELIPLCHPLPLTGVTVKITPDEAQHAYLVVGEVATGGKTGVEMEALSAVMTACLTVYDMAKAIDKGMIIDEVMLVEKSGGQSGDFNRQTK